MRDTKVISISLPQKMADELDKKAKKSGIAKSEVFRVALVRYLKEEEEEQIFSSMMKEKAKELGISSEEDVEKVINSVRK